MQNKEITSSGNNPRDMSSHTQQLAEHIGNLWQNTHLPSAETLKQTLVNLPEPYQTMGIQAIAEHFVNTIQIHLLQTLATFYQQAADEGIDEGERDETLKDVEDKTYRLMMLSKHLAIDSLESLLRLGKITSSVLDLSQCDNAEEAQRWIYKLSNIYQSRLEQEHLAEKGVDTIVKFPFYRGRK
jgi:hypothetical protein